MKFRNAFLSGAFLLFGACVAQAAVTAVNVAQVDPGDVITGYVINDLSIDFNNDPLGLGFQQLVLELTAGTIYQDDAGENIAPSETFVNLIPTLEFDTFVTVGGATSQVSEDSLEVGGAVNIVPGSAKKFDDQGLNITWAPATGVNIPEGSDFLTARISLSDDAVGTLRYIGVGNSDAAAAWWQGETTIAGGIIAPFGDGGGEPPVATDVLIDEILAGEAATGNFAATDADGDALTWTNLQFTGYTPGFGGNGPADPTVNATLGDDGAFSWETLGYARGTYAFSADVSDGETTVSGLLEVNVTAVPEPSTIALLGLSVVGLVGLARRRK